MKRTLDVAEGHQLKIARDSMKKSCIFAVMVGIDHPQSAQIIKRLTGQTVANTDCTCPAPFQPNRFN